MMVVKDPACLQVALKVRGDAGRGKGGTQKSVDAVHSLFRKGMVRLPGIEPGSPPWKGGIIAPRLQARLSARGRSVEGLDHIGL